MSGIESWNWKSCDCGRPGGLIESVEGAPVLCSNPPQYHYACRACGQVWLVSRHDDDKVTKYKHWASKPREEAEP